MCYEINTGEEASFLIWKTSDKHEDGYELQPTAGMYFVHFRWSSRENMLHQERIDELE